MFAKEVIKKRLREIKGKNNLTEKEKGFVEGYKKALTLLKNKKQLEKEIYKLENEKNKSSKDWGKIKKLKSALELLKV